MRSWGTSANPSAIPTTRTSESVHVGRPPRRIPSQPAEEPYVQWWHTPDDDLAEVDPNALAYAGNLVVAMLPGLAEFCHGRKSGGDTNK